MRMLLLLFAVLPVVAAEPGWISLFNGTDLAGWKANENPQTFSVNEGAIVASGPRSHLFYMGDVRGHSFRNFELKVDVMTRPGANGGIYILTGFQETGWPGKGFEIQVNNSYPRDPRRTGSIYQVKDVLTQEARDNEWFTEHIVVRGDTITVRVNDKVVAEWTQPPGWNGTAEFPERKLAPGTIALQGHDPGSTIYYKNILIKPLD